MLLPGLEAVRKRLLISPTHFIRNVGAIAPELGLAASCCSLSMYWVNYSFSLQSPFYFMWKTQSAMQPSRIDWGPLLLRGFSKGVYVGFYCRFSISYLKCTGAEVFPILGVSHIVNY